MRLLVIDDELESAERTLKLLQEDQHFTQAVASRASALAAVGEDYFDAALLDLRLGEENGLQLLPDLLEENPRLDVIALTEANDHDTAVEAMRLGALDYLSAPFSDSQLRGVINKLAKSRRLRGRLDDLELRMSSDLPPMFFDTANPVMSGALEVVAKAADSQASILILGESGTGKSVFARFVHQNSPQRDNAFVTISCPSLSPQLLSSELFGYVKGAFTGADRDTWGKVAEADEGTLFLDEIGELPLDIQPKLLRLLQEREYERVGEAKTRSANVRVIAATNVNLDQAVEDGSFREDLLYRLNVITVTMPPLRERAGDLMAVATSYLGFFARQCGKKITGIAAAAERALLRYPWPGNLRELRNYIERAVIMAEHDQIRLEDLPRKVRLGEAEGGDNVGLGLGDRVPLATIEREHLRRVLDQTDTIEEAAEILGINAATIYRKRKKYGLQ